MVVLLTPTHHYLKMFGKFLLWLSYIIWNTTYEGHMLVLQFILSWISMYPRPASWGFYLVAVNSCLYKCESKLMMYNSGTDFSSPNFHSCFSAFSPSTYTCLNQTLTVLFMICMTWLHVLVHVYNTYLWSIYCKHYICLQSYLWVPGYWRKYVFLNVYLSWISYLINTFDQVHVHHVLRLWRLPVTVEGWDQQ